MNREQLAHVLRAACQIADDSEILVLGSQAILGSFKSEELPEEATMSVEADIAFWDDPDEAKADQVDGAIGEYSSFHEMYGYYAQGVSVETAVLPAGWEDRVVVFKPDDANPASARCIEAHDLVVSKLIAGREKDLSFAAALIEAKIVDPDTLLERSAAIDRPEAIRQAVADRVLACKRRAEHGS